MGCAQNKSSLGYDLPSLPLSVGRSLLSLTPPLALSCVRARTRVNTDTKKKQTDRMDVPSADPLQSLHHDIEPPNVKISQTISPHKVQKPPECPGWLLAAYKSCMNSEQDLLHKSPTTTVYKISGHGKKMALQASIHQTVPGWTADTSKEWIAFAGHVGLNCPTPKLYASCWLVKEGIFLSAQELFDLSLWDVFLESQRVFDLPASLDRNAQRDSLYRLECAAMGTIATLECLVKNRSGGRFVNTGIHPKRLVVRGLRQVAVIGLDPYAVTNGHNGETGHMLLWMALQVELTSLLEYRTRVRQGLYLPKLFGYTRGRLHLRGRDHGLKITIDSDAPDDPDFNLYMDSIRSDPIVQGATAFAWGPEEGLYLQHIRSLCLAIVAHSKMSSAFLFCDSRCL